MSIDPISAIPQSPDASWCVGVRAQLDREANALDSVTAARLAAARHRALAVALDKSPRRGWPWLGGAIAASLLLAVLMMAVRPPIAPTRSTAASAPATSAPVGSPATISPPGVESDIAVIADLEFYDWLEEQDALL